MTTEIIISILLTIIGFFLAGIFYEQRRTSRNVEQLLINQAAIKEQLSDHERRIERIELLKPTPHG